MLPTTHTHNEPPSELAAFDQSAHHSLHAEMNCRILMSNGLGGGLVVGYDLEIRFDRGKSERSRELVWLSGSFGANLRRPVVVQEQHKKEKKIRSELMR